MLLDDRLLGANATLDSRNEWAVHSWPQVELIWMFMILLNLARLLHIDPIVIHILNLTLKHSQLPNTAVARVGYCEDQAQQLQI